MMAEIVDMKDGDIKSTSNPISTFLKAEKKSEKTTLEKSENKLFKNVKISNDDLKQQLPDFDTRSTITSKSLKGMHLKKKDKLKMKHELWIKKLSAIKTAKQEAKERKRKQQTPVVGDIGVLGEALPTLDLLLKSATKGKNKPQEKPRSIPKEKRRKKQMMQDIAVFQQVLGHPAFVDKPEATIHEHLQNKLRQEEQMDS